MKSTKLSITHIAEPDFAKAAKGLLANARRLVVAGFFQEAHQALLMQVEPGPWKLQRHGAIMQELQDFLPQVCFLCGEGVPEIGDLAAMNKADLAQRIAADVAQRLASLKAPVRNQLRPAGGKWSKEYFEEMAVEKDGKLYAEFLIDLEFVLKARLAKPVPGAKPAPTMASFWNALMAGTKLPDAQEFNLLDMITQEIKIEVDPAANAYSTARLEEILLAAIEDRGIEMTYVEEFCLQGMMQICLVRGMEMEAVRAACMLARSEAGLSALSFAAVDPVVGPFFSSGACAIYLGIDKAGVAKYMAALKTRVERPVAVKAPKPGKLQDTLAGFSAHFAGTPLGERAWAEVPIDGSDDCAYAIRCKASEAEALWKLARERVASTGRWPLVAQAWVGENADLDALLREADFFSRRPFEGALDVDDISAAAIIAAAKSADVDSFLLEKAAQRSEEFEAEEALEYHLESTEMRTGAAPTETELKAAIMKVKKGGLIQGEFVVEKALLDWEQANGGSGNPQDALQEWFEPTNAVLLFLPTPNSWEALAYLHFWGVYEAGSEVFVALCRQWHEQYGAELYAHFGTMLEFFVARPPKDLEQSFRLAMEHDLAASCTLALPGIDLRHYAVALLEADRWFLHERP